MSRRVLVTVVAVGTMLLAGVLFVLASRPAISAVPLERIATVPVSEMESADASHTAALMLGRMGLAEKPIRVRKDVDRQSGRSYLRVETAGGLEIGFDAQTGKPTSVWIPGERRSSAPKADMSDQGQAATELLQQLRDWGFEIPEGSPDRVNDDGESLRFIWNRKIDGRWVFPDVTLLAVDKKSGAMRSYNRGHFSANPVSREAKLESADAVRIVSGLLEKRPGLTVVSTSTPELMYVASDEASKDEALQSGTYLCWSVRVRGEAPEDGRVFLSAVDGKVVAAYTP